MFRRLKSLRALDLIYGLGTAWVLVQLALAHRWFTRPFSVWIGLDDAYVAAAGQRLLDGHWLPYVDAVSHRGPLLYWISAILQSVSTDGWMGPRLGSFLFAEAAAVLIFAIGAAAKRPFAGFFGAAVFTFATTFAMAPHDGMAFNGELVAVPFVLGAVLVTVYGLRDEVSAERRVWIAALAGFLTTLGALGKQPALAHLVPIALWWASDQARRRGSSKTDWRPLIGIVVGAVTPWLALLSFYLRTGHLRTLLYYLFTYNKKVYFAPVTAGMAVESTYAYFRMHSEVVLIVLVVGAWAAAQWLSSVQRIRSPRSWLEAYAETGLISTVAFNGLLAFGAAVATFRFFDHYFVTAVPWVGLWAGLIVDGSLKSLPARRAWASAILVSTVCLFLAITGVVHRHWLDGQRRMGLFGDPHDEPVTNYIIATTRPGDRIFTWGFAPEYYVSTRRKAASRFVFTTFVSGLVPWFDHMTIDQENALAVPGSRDLLIRELEANQPELVLDVPSSLRGRSMRRYEQLAAWLERSYCYEATIVGRNSHVADVYRRKSGECSRSMPPR